MNIIMKIIIFYFPVRTSFTVVTVHSYLLHVAVPSSSHDFFCFGFHLLTRATCSLSLKSPFSFSTHQIWTHFESFNPLQILSFGPRPAILCSFPGSLGLQISALSPSACLLVWLRLAIPLKHRWVPYSLKR